MKNIFKLFSLAIIVLVASCTEPDDIITGSAQEGALLGLSGSGSLAGAPAPGVDLSEASITFQSAGLNYDVQVVAGMEGVSQLVTYKSFAGQKIEVVSAAASEGISLELTQVSEFLEGFSGLTAADLRVGDAIVFSTELVMKDGRVLKDNTALLAVSVSCLADLTGTYLVTNSWCSPSFMIEITQNADGTYFLPIADGGGLDKCTGNNGPNFYNSGTIQEQCGEILPTAALRYGTDGSGNEIGDIVGGSWDAANGIIILENTQAFTPNWPAEWTSTYTRQ